MGYMTDYRGAGYRLDEFIPERDMGGVLAHFDPDDVPGSNGAAVPTWASRWGGVTFNLTPAAKPTVLAAAVTDSAGRPHKMVRCATSSYLRNVTSINDTAPSGGHPQPLTFVLAIRITASAATASNHLVFGASGANLQLAQQGQALYVNAGTAGTVQGPELTDGAVHIVVATMTTAGWRIYVDGYLVGSTSGTQQQGSGVLGNLFIGSGLGVALPAGVTFDYGDLIVSTSPITPARVAAVTAALAKKWGIATTGAQRNGVDFVDTVDSAGQPVRYWMPPGTGAAPLLIWSHPYTQTEQIAHGVNVYPWVHAAVQEGWMVAASRMHDANWGNDQAQTDIANLHTLINSIRSVSKALLVGGSMGGLASMIAAARGTVPNIAGVAVSDAVLDLVWAYTGNSGGYASAINAAYGISAVGGIPASNDPMQISAAAFGGRRYRFYASSSDTSVAKSANVDAFRTKIGSVATEAELVTHNTSGHLNAGAFPPADLVAFAKRCGL